MCYGRNTQNSGGSVAASHGITFLDNYLRWLSGQRSRHAHSALTLHPSPRLRVALVLFGLSLSASGGNAQSIVSGEIHGVIGNEPARS